VRTNTIDETSIIPTSNKGPFYPFWNPKWRQTPETLSERPPITWEKTKPGCLDRRARRSKPYVESSCRWDVPGSLRLLFHRSFVRNELSFLTLWKWKLSVY